MLPFKNILVHYDSRFTEHPALDAAVELAKANGGRLKIVEMLPEFAESTKQLATGHDKIRETVTLAKAKYIAETVAAPLRAQGLDVTTAVLEGKTSVALIRDVLRDEHDLVVKGSKGQHSRSFGFFGTSATRLLRKCPCPVLIVRADRPYRCQRVVGAVSAESEDRLHQQLNRRIIELATQAAAAPPDIVNVWSIYGESILKDYMRPEEFATLEVGTERHARQKLGELLQEIGLSAGQVRLQLLRGEPGEIIPRFVQEHDVDLVVMGTVARSGLAGILLGNTAEQILDRIECSVLAIKPAGFVSPIHL